MIHFYCLECGRKFQVKDEFGGRSTRCSTCKSPLQVPLPDRTEASVPIARLVVADGGTAAGQRVGALASATVAYHGDSDLPVAEVLARDGQSRGRYLIDKEIARGGMGAVLRGIDRDIRREIAVKVMLDDANPGKQARFVEEAQITGQLEHPNIVPVHELGLDEQQRPFFTMKLVKGRSLDDILRSLSPLAPGGRGDGGEGDTPWPLGRLLNILVNICHALSYAHSRNVIHRDLKPANIMVGDFGEVYVMDWGLAKVLAPAATPAPLIVATPLLAKYLPAAPTAEPSSTLATASGSARVSTNRQQEADLTLDGSILGTPAYMAPEQAHGRVQEIGQRSDIYALGGILYAVLTLQPPVEKGGGQMELLLRVAEGEIKRPEERTPDRFVPPELSAIAMKALAKEPKDRYQTVESFRRDLELFLTGHSVSAKHDTFKEQVWKLIKRNQGASIATAASLLVLLVVAGIFFKVNYDARVQAENNYNAYLKEQERRRASVPSFLTAAKLLLDNRDFAGAGVQVGLVLQLAPDHLEARRLRGQLAVIRHDFAAARADLEFCVRQHPKDLLIKELLTTMSRFAAKEEATALVLAETFARHGAFALADGVVSVLGKDLPGVRDKLLALYRSRIDKAWPGRGAKLTWSADGGLGLDLSGFAELVDLSPLRGMPLTALIISGCGRLHDLSPLKGLPLTSLICFGTPVSDLSPLKGMPLTSLICNGTNVSDLSPLQRMLTLTTLNCAATRVSELSPLKGLPLTSLHCFNTPVSDLSPLKGLQLATLGCMNTHVSDLSPLKGMPLTTLFCDQTQVSDLSPLKEMPLTTLHCSHTPVWDLSPLKGMMRLTTLRCNYTRVSDLSPLKGLKLTDLRFTPAKITRGVDVIRMPAMPSLKTIGSDFNVAFPAAEFWQRYDKGEFKK